jgi:hypothetical protein
MIVLCEHCLSVVYTFKRFDSVFVSLMYIFFFIVDKDVQQSVFYGLIYKIIVMNMVVIEMAMTL